MDQIDKSVMKDALVEAFAQFQLKKIIKNELLKAINEEKWITIHPHGDVEDEDGHKDYRRIKLEDGETPKEAIERVYKKGNDKTDKGEKGNKEVNGNKKETEDLSKRIQELEEKAKKFGGENTVLGKKYLQQVEELKKQLNKDNTSNTSLFAEFNKYEKQKKELDAKYDEIRNKALAELESNKEYKDLRQQRDKIANDLIKLRWSDNREKYYELVAKKNKISDKIVALNKQIYEKAGVYKAQQAVSEISDKMYDIKHKTFNLATEKIKDKIASVSKDTDKILNNITKAINVKEYNKLLSQLEVADKDEKGKWKKIDEHPFYSQEREEARTIWRKSMDEKSAINKKLNEYKENFVNIVAKELQVKNGIKKLNLVAGSVHQKANIEKLQKALSGVIPENVYSNRELKLNTKSGRANHSGRTINVPKDARIATLIHETMHNLEEDNKTILLNSLAFVNYRTKDEKQIALRKLYPNNGYAAKEICKKDNFFDAYCGKFYTLTGGRNQQYVNCWGSEIMSMGVQELFTNPLEFAKKDREYFNFVIANLRGLI